MEPLFRKQQLRLRWGAAALAALIGTVSVWALFVTAVRLYFEYVYYPHVKAQDGYIYPQLRYTLFDAMQVVWCLTGLLAAALLLRNFALRKGVTGWARRMTILFFAGFGVLAVGVAFGVWLRSHGI